MAQDFPAHVAVIGGGRWARVVAAVLTDMAPPRTRLTLCSPSNPDGWAAWMSTRTTLPVTTQTVVEDLDAVLGDRTIEFVAIARAAREHAATTIAALRAGKRVLVEKPFAVTLAEAERVREVARTGKCHTGLVLLFASNLERFATAARSVRDVEHIRVVWRDQRREARYGEAKTYDTTLNCLLDVFPHVWSLLRRLYPGGSLAPVDATTSDGGRSVTLRLDLGSARVEVEIARDSPERMRYLEVRGAAETAFIDFSREPGTAEIHGRPVDVASGFSSPLARELNAAALGIFEPLAGTLCSIERAIESIRIAEELLPSIRRDQLEQIVAGLRGEPATATEEIADFALRELAGAALGRAGLAPASPGQLVAVRDWLGGSAGAEKPVSAITSDPDFRDLKKRLAE